MEKIKRNLQAKAINDNLATPNTANCIIFIWSYPHNFYNEWEYYAIEFSYAKLSTIDQEVCLSLSNQHGISITHTDVDVHVCQNFP